MATRHPDLGLEVPNIWLPAADVPLETWAVIACDQHTSQPDYWERVAEIVGERPSTLRLVFPEAFLEAADRPERIDTIRAAMADYVRRGVLVDHGPGFVLVDRKTPHAPSSRRGLIVALDLERYSYAADATSLIRTTEGTVLSRLPPRVEIRREAPLELPHIMVLIDDPERTVIEPLCERPLPALYDTELMLGGGHVRGWHVADTAGIDHVVDALRRLLARQQEPPFLYAMGDGNHSFATALEVWNEIKVHAGGVDAVGDHPARHALVELVNLHDDGLVFEPIHRALFDVDLDELLTAMCAYYRSQGSDAEVVSQDGRDAWLQARAALDEADDHHLPFVAGTASGERRYGILTVHRPAHDVEAVSLQEFVGGYETRHPDLRVDYIHGEDAIEALAGTPGTVGLLAQTLDKHALFDTIRHEGPLPRKSFSLGEAEEKRYYLECRRILP